MSIERFRKYVVCWVMVVFFYVCYFIYFVVCSRVSGVVYMKEDYYYLVCYMFFEFFYVYIFFIYWVKI